MGVRKTLALALLWVYLAIGVALSACTELGFADRWATQRLAAMEELEPLAIRRITSLHAVLEGDVAFHVEVEVEDHGGKLHVLRGTTSAFGLVPWSGIWVRLGSTSFDAGTAVQPVDPDGTVSYVATALEPQDREQGLLVFLHEGREQRWFLFAALPTPEGRPADEIIDVGTLRRIPLDQPITEASRRKRRAAAVCLRPLAIAVDVVTWPIQAAMLVYTFSRISIH